MHSSGAITLESERAAKTRPAATLGATTGGRSSASKVRFFSERT
jgi:hypothetical protein